MDHKLEFDHHPPHQDETKSLDSKEKIETGSDFSLTPVELEPFLHQVGGHSSILCLDEGTICKPLITRELQFYETIPKCLKPFTPEYRGVIQVRFVEDADGYIRLDAYAPKSATNQLHRDRDTPKRRERNRRIRLKKSGSIDIEPVNHGEHHLLKKVDLDLSQDGNLENALERRPSVSLSIPMPLPIRTLSSTAPTTPTELLLHNPWALQCQKNQLNKLRSQSVPQNFLLLENITRRLEHPCVLDLKMGTQQYGDDASPDKIRSKSAKAGNSTSVQLGVRICGMQVYQVSSGNFVCRDKYYGQKLDVSGFQKGLTQFLHNGRRLRRDALDALLAKLNDLRQVLMTLDTFRFYTSSLLLAYEGFDDEETNFNQDNQFRSPSLDVDVRMIDFAHSTFPDLEKKKHEGPDAGYIFGLSNLISTLEEISKQ